jgi:putative membrane protein
MNRRLLLASIATMAASRVAAQSTQAPAPAQTVAPPAPEGGLSGAQQKHINETMAVGSLSLMLSRIAQPKVKHPLLKQFVEFEIAEQETVADVLKAIRTKGPLTGSIAAPSDADLMQNLDDQGKAAVEKLKNTPAGSQFDHDYHRYEVEGHRKLLDIQEVYLKAPDNLDETNVAKLARGMIKEHLTLLGDLNNVG